MVLEIPPQFRPDAELRRIPQRASPVRSASRHSFNFVVLSAPMKIRNSFAPLTEIVWRNLAKFQLNKKFRPAGFPARQFRNSFFPQARAGAVANGFRHPDAILFSGLTGDCAAGIEKQFVQAEFLDRRLRDKQVAEVNRVERTAKQSLFSIFRVQSRYETRKFSGFGLRRYPEPAAAASRHRTRAIVKRCFSCREYNRSERARKCRSRENRCPD